MRRFAGIAALVAFAAAGGPPAKLELITAPVQVQAGSCSPLLTVQLQDDGGTAVDAGADLAVGLSGAVEFHDLATCGSPPIAQVQIDAGTNAASFRVLETVAGRYPVTASAAGLASATQEVEVLPGAPRGISLLDGPYTVNAGECSPRMAFLLNDAYGNVSPPPPPGLTLSVTASSSNVHAYADPACSVPLGSLAISAPDAGAAFYFQSFAAETFFLTVSAPGFASAQEQRVRPVSVDLALELEDGPGTTGAALAVHAFVTNTGQGTLSAPRLVLSSYSLALSDAGPYLLPDIPPGFTAEREVSGIITAPAGVDVVVQGRVETSGGWLFEPEAWAHQPVVPMVADLGGCGCGAGGFPLAAAGVVVLALTTALRDTRRRSVGSR